MADQAGVRPTAVQRHFERVDDEVCAHVVGH
jgi:hypothetical protein